MKDVEVTLQEADSTQKRFNETSASKLLMVTLIKERFWREDYRPICLFDFSYDSVYSLRRTTSGDTEWQHKISHSHKMQINIWRTRSKKAGFFSFHLPPENRALCSSLPETKTKTSWTVLVGCSEQKALTLRQLRCLHQSERDKCYERGLVTLNLRSVPAQVLTNSLFHWLPFTIQNVPFCYFCLFPILWCD